MKKIIILFVFSSFSSLALAAEQSGDGRNEAVKTCQQGTMSAEKECMAIVGKSDYFDIRAAKACGTLTSSGMVKCMEAIKDKTFLTAEVDMCKDKTSSSAPPCFQSAGKPYRYSAPATAPARVDNRAIDDAISELRSIQRRIDDIVRSLERTR